MNSYRVWYSYTEPSCECPEVLVIGDNMFIDVIAHSHQAAKKYINDDSYLNRMHENFRVIRSKLLEKDVHELKKVDVDGVKQKHGVGASFSINGEEVAVVARHNRQLQEIGVSLFGDSFVLDESKLKPVSIAMITNKDNGG